MEAPRLSMSLLLLLLLSTYPPASSQNCSHADLEILDTVAKDLQPVLSTDDNGSKHLYQHSFLQPEPGFLGLSFEVEGTTTVFFSAADHCFPGNDTRWWELRVEYEYSKLLEDITCRVFVGECYWWCVKNHTFQQDLPSLRLLTHGPSRWRSTRPLPDTCVVQDWQLSPSYKDRRTCRAPPSSTQRHTNIDATTTTNIDAAITTNIDRSTNTYHHNQLSKLGVVLVMVTVPMVVVVVVVAREKCQGSVAAPPAPVAI